MDCQTLYDDRKRTNYMKTIDGGRIGDSHKKVLLVKGHAKLSHFLLFEKTMIVEDYQNRKITWKIEVGRRRLKIFYILSSLLSLITFPHVQWLTLSWNNIIDICTYKVGHKVGRAFIDG